MATSSSFQPDDQLTCSICLEVYTEPVSIPCGHNFCKACLSRHWAGKERCKCPLCNEKFNKGLQLHINTEFREIVEKFKNQNKKGDSKSALKPGQVPCDCCLGKKVRASKTCLVCLVSFCETHLDLHLKVAAFKRHKLTHPVHKLEEKICKRHNRILEFFCRSDQTRVCALCTEHSDHDTVHLDEAYVDKSYRMRKRKEVVQETKQKKREEVKAQSKRKGKGVKSNRTKGPDPFPQHIEVPLHHNGLSYISHDTGFSEGTFTFEFNVKDQAICFMGVLRESVFRRRKFSFNSDGCWIIRLQNNWHIEKVVMHLDYKNGQLLFFDANSKEEICSCIGCDFREKLILFFDPGQPFNLEQRIQRYVQRKLKEIDAAFIIIPFVLYAAACFIWQS